MKFKVLLLTLSLFTMANFAQADQSMKAKVKEAGNDAARATKQGVRDVKDKTCEMVNGKMECAAQKVKHKVQQGADKVEDAMD